MVCIIKNTDCFFFLTATGSLEGWIEEAGESFLVRRDAATSLPIITHHIRGPGKVVYSDEWSAYRLLSATTGNVHPTVKH